jgi:hypothetical protein
MLYCLITSILPTVSSTNKIDYHNITEILFKVTLNTITLTLKRTSIINAQKHYYLKLISEKKISESIWVAFVFYFIMNSIDGLMISMLALGVLDRGFETIKLVIIVASPLSMQHKEARAYLFVLDHYHKWELYHANCLKQQSTVRYDIRTIGVTWNKLNFKIL